MFSPSERCCATMFPHLQVIRLTHGNLLTNTVIWFQASRTMCLQILSKPKHSSTKKIILVFMQVHSLCYQIVVQTALSYTMYLLLTQLNEAPPSLTSPATQYVSSFLTLGLQLIRNHKCSTSVRTSKVPDFNSPTCKADCVSPVGEDNTIHTSDI